MDKRIAYYLILDTETANSLDDPLMYDVGGAIVDKRGTVYETFSFIVREIFYKKELFNTAYYAEKRPIYENDILSGNRNPVSIYFARQYIRNLCAKYSVKAICAHNARFDYRSTSTTIRYVSTSRCRFFLPYGIPIWDTLKMAQDTICKQPTYIRWCERNGYLQKNGKPRATAEILYRYIILDTSFIESHTGLEDVLIEKEIFCRCMAQHKKMRKNVWS